MCSLIHSVCTCKHAILKCSQSPHKLSTSFFYFVCNFSAWLAYTNIWETLEGGGYLYFKGVRLFIFLQPRITAEFLYFGLRFCSLNVTIDRESDKIALRKFEDIVFSSELECSNKFIKEIKDDIKSLRHESMGEKLVWNPDGAFVKVPNTHIYVYHHTQHASCSKVLLSSLQSDWDIDKEWKCLDDKLECDHSDHNRLLPFFYDNRFLKHHYTRLISEGTSDAQIMLDELNDIEQKMENMVDLHESEFWRPMSLVNNWNENDWSKRLYVGIKKTFQIHTVYTADITFFTKYLRMMNIENLEKCFLFRGYPDIIVHRKCAVVVSSHTAAEADDIPPSTSECSSDEDALVETSWQKNPLKGLTGDHLPEKLGELLSGLYILMVSKILRRIKKGKNIHLHFQVKGVLLDKTTANVLCTMSVGFKQGVAVPKIHIIDYMGSVLTVESLCYLIRGIINTDSSGRQPEGAVQTPTVDDGH